MSYEKKKQKVITMLEILKEDGNIFEDLYNLVNLLDDISEGLLDSIYEIITKAMYSLKEQELEESIDKLERIKDKLAVLRGIEEQEAVNSEEILNKIN